MALAKDEFITLSTVKMPFGKYKGLRLVDLPGPYLVWFSRKGFSEGKLGRLLQTVHEIKLNGLELISRRYLLVGCLKKPGAEHMGDRV